MRHLTHRLREPEDYGLAVSGATLKVDFLARQTSPAVVEQFQSAGWSIDFHEAHVKARLFGAPPPGFASIALMRGPADSSWYAASSPRGTLVCTPPGEPIDGRITPGFHCTALTVPGDLWERSRLIAGVERTEFGAAVVCPLPPAIFDPIEYQLLLLKARLSAADDRLQAMESASSFVIRMMTLAWEQNNPVQRPRESLRNRLRLARRAEEWMRGHLDQPVQVPELCLALRVSRRELEYAFRSAFDQSPRDYLQALRLNAVRYALQSSVAAAETVIRVAMDHGFTHPSRFAASYRTMFGEYPKETLQAHR